MENSQVLFYLIVRNRLHDILAPNIDRYNIQQYEFIACEASAEIRTSGSSST